MGRGNLLGLACSFSVASWLSASDRACIADAMDSSRFTTPVAMGGKGGPILPVSRTARTPLLGMQIAFCVMGLTVRPNGV